MFKIINLNTCTGKSNECSEISIASEHLDELWFRLDERVGRQAGELDQGAAGEAGAGQCGQTNRNKGEIE